MCQAALGVRAASSVQVGAHSRTVETIVLKQHIQETALLLTMCSLCAGGRTQKAAAGS